jgi:predicted amidophosphoribosyltransferase
MRCPLRTCTAVLEASVDWLGQVRWACDGCARRRAGVCAQCPRPVDGTTGKAKYCAEHRREMSLAGNRRWLHYNRDARNARARMKKRRNPASPMSPQAAGRLGGAIGGKVRAARLTPERRREIAAHAAAVRYGR